MHIRAEQTFKGNYHLTANIDGRDIKMVYRKDSMEAQRIDKQGISNIDEVLVMELINRIENFR